MRTRRDSKHGFSFINLHDGSCFDPIQVVADQALENYADEILHLTTGCAVIATGELVESKGKGQPVEIQARPLPLVPHEFHIAPGDTLGEARTQGLEGSLLGRESTGETFHTTPTLAAGSLCRCEETIQDAFSIAFHQRLHALDLAQIHTESNDQDIPLS